MTAPASPPRLVRLEDLAEIRAEDARAFPGAAFPSDPAHRQAWWAVDGDPSLGYCGAALGPEPGRVRLTRAFVSEAMRGGGLQRRMILTRLRWAKARGACYVTTYTSADNVPSMRSLVGAGFRPTRFEPDEDAGGGWILWGRDL